MTKLLIPIPRGEWDEYCKTHRRLFQHNPRPDWGSGELCTHPMHRELQQMLEAPGADIEIDWELGASKEITTDDELGLWVESEMAKLYGNPDDEQA